MRSTLQVLGLIALGAIAAGIGSGYFLFAANRDRTELQEKIRLAEEHVKELQHQSEQLADSAEDRIQVAEDEIQRAQAFQLALEQEYALKERATVLKPSKSTQSWKEVLGLTLGITVKVPQQSVESVSDQSISVSQPTVFGSWLQIERYTPERLKALTPQSGTSTVYVSTRDGILFQGQRYDLGAYKQLLVTAQKNASTTHLILLTTQEQIPEKVLIDTLSTIQTR